MPDGSRTVDEYTLTNTNGMEMKVITYGGIITSNSRRPIAMGNLEDIVLGCDNLEAIIWPGTPYFRSNRWPLWQSHCQRTLFNQWPVEYELVDE